MKLFLENLFISNHYVPSQQINDKLEKISLIMNHHVLHILASVLVALQTTYNKVITFGKCLSS